MCLIDVSVSGDPAAAADGAALPTAMGLIGVKA